MGFGEVLVAIAGMGATATTLIVYLVMRAEVAKRQVHGVPAGVQQAIEALRAEIAALKQHETEAVLSFDTTLQRLDARVQHLEQRALSHHEPEPASLGAGHGREEPAWVEQAGARTGR
jgi:hypothetical protein